jgi:hypothetical protein
MKAIADKILETIKDYRNDDGVFLNSEHIINLGNQFGEDAEFMLNEINHIIPQVYVSKEKAKLFIDSHIEALIKEFKYSNISDFWINTEFLDLQLPHKSLPAILNILETLLNEKYGESYVKYVTYPKVNFVYFDDILASGYTVGKHLKEWLEAKNADGVINISNILNNNYRLSVNLFGLHT